MSSKGRRMITACAMRAVLAAALVAAAAFGPARPACAQHESGESTATVTVRGSGAVTFSAKAPKAGTPAADGQKMSGIQAIILGLTEGVTEYLPVSSTGHLYVVSRLIGVYKTEADKEAADAYSICIQFGAILAVLVLFMPRFMSMIKGLLGQDAAGRMMAFNVVSAFIPAAVLGVALEKPIKKILFGLWPITAAWLVGGIVILAFSRNRISISKTEHKLEELRPKQAALIGLMQCLALWPGVSRSLVTILGGVFVGMSLTAAVEFSFLLGFVTLTAATCYEFLKEGRIIISTFGVVSPLIGLVVSFVSAAAAVKWMVSYLNSRGLSIFGYYRIALAVVVAALIISGKVF